MKLELSPDLLPRRRLRHWLAARGNGAKAWQLAVQDADARRLRSIQLSGHGTPSLDSGEDRGARSRVAPVLRLVKARRSA